MIGRFLSFRRDLAHPSSSSTSSGVELRSFVIAGGKLNLSRAFSAVYNLSHEPLDLEASAPISALERDSSLDRNARYLSLHSPPRASIREEALWCSCKRIFPFLGMCCTVPTSSVTNFAVVESLSVGDAPALPVLRNAEDVQRLERPAVACVSVGFPGRGTLPSVRQVTKLFGLLRFPCSTGARPRGILPAPRDVTDQTTVGPPTPKGQQEYARRNGRRTYGTSRNPSRVPETVELEEEVRITVLS